MVAVIFSAYRKPALCPRGHVRRPYGFGAEDPRDGHVPPRRRWETFGGNAAGSPNARNTLPRARFPRLRSIREKNQVLLIGNLLRRAVFPRGKNNFAVVSKNSAGTDEKIILCWTIKVNIAVGSFDILAPTQTSNIIFLLAQHHYS